jgi:hypothetical protein
VHAAIVHRRQQSTTSGISCYADRRPKTRQLYGSWQKVVGDLRSQSSKKRSFLDRRISRCRGLSGPGWPSFAGSDGWLPAGGGTPADDKQDPARGTSRASGGGSHGRTASTLSGRGATPPQGPHPAPSPRRHRSGGTVRGRAGPLDRPTGVGRGAMAGERGRHGQRLLAHPRRERRVTVRRTSVPNACRRRRWCPAKCLIRRPRLRGRGRPGVTERAKRSCQEASCSVKSAKGPRPTAV